MRSTSLLVLGLLLGIAIGAPLIQHYQGFIIEYTLKLGVALLFGLLSLALTFIVGFRFLNRFAKKRLGVERYSADAIAQRITDLAWNVFDLDRDSARRTSGQLVSQVVSYVSIFSFYRWLFGLFIAVVAALGGTLGTIVLINQNEKIGEQTEVAREQYNIAVQQFIRMKSDELELIVRKIGDLRNKLSPEDLEELSRLYRNDDASLCWKTSNAAKATNSGKSALPASVRTDAELIGALVLSALEGASSNKSHHQSFRANLLRILATAGLPFSVYGHGTFSDLTLAAGNFKGANFDDLKLDKVTLGGGLFQGICLSNLHASRLSARGVDFSASVFENAWFAGANLVRAKFDKAKILGSENYNPGYSDYEYFTFTPDEESGWRGWLKYLRRKLAQILRWDEGYADTYWIEDSFSRSSFMEAKLERSSFEQAELSRVSFDDAKLVGASFRGALLSGPLTFVKADLSHADFRISPNSRAALKDTDFTGAKLDNTALDDVDFGNNKTVSEDQILAACVCSGQGPQWQGKSFALGQCRIVQKEADAICGRRTDEKSQAAAPVSNL